MSNIIAGAMQGLGGAVKDAGLEMLRSEITKERDARLNEYAVSIETDVKQPFRCGADRQGHRVARGHAGTSIASTEGIQQARQGIKRKDRCQQTQIRQEGRVSGPAAG